MVCFKVSAFHNVAFKLFDFFHDIAEIIGSRIIVVIIFTLHFFWYHSVITSFSVEMPQVISLSNLLTFITLLFYYFTDVMLSIVTDSYSLQGVQSENDLRVQSYIILRFYWHANKYIFLLNLSSNP